jgi:hypothetical protein
VAQGPSIGEWAALAAACASVAGGAVIVSRGGADLAGAGLLAVPAGVAIGLAAAGAQGVRYGLAAGIVAFEALFQTGAAIVDRGS